MKGLAYARHVLTDEERLGWVCAKREGCRGNQLAFVDATTSFYKTALETMPGQAGKLYYHVASYYGQPF